MQHAKYGVAVAVAAMFAISGTASAATCNIVGTWTDLYGSTATFTTQTKGTATVSSLVCGTAGTVYNVKLKPITNGVTAIAKPPVGVSCPIVKATLKYAKGSCTSASGPVKFNGTTLQDTWTKKAAADAALTEGLQ